VLLKFVSILFGQVLSVANLNEFVKSYTLNNAGLFQPKCGSNIDKPKCLIKNVIKIFNPTFNCIFFFLNYILNQHFGLSNLTHIWIETTRVY